MYPNTVHMKSKDVSIQMLHLKSNETQIYTLYYTTVFVFLPLNTFKMGVIKTTIWFIYKSLKGAIEFLSHVFCTIFLNILGLGIRSSVIQANCSFLWAKDQFARIKEQITPIALLSWATGANHSRTLFCKERLSRRATGAIRSWAWKGEKQRKNCQIHTIIMNFFKGIARFWERFAELTRESLMSLLFTDNSNSLMVALLSWATWANRSRLLFC